MQASLERRVLGRTHNDALVELFRASPIVADFTVCFDRHPDFFAFPELAYDSYEYQGLFQRDRLVGCVMCAVLTGWLGPRRGYGTYCYAGDGRTAPDVRGGHAVMSAAFDMVREHEEAPLVLGVIKEGNRPAAHLVETLDYDDFEVHELARFEAANIILLHRRRRDLTTRVRRATARDIPEMAEVMARAFRGRLFAPRITAERLARDTERMPGLGIGQYYVAIRDGRIVGALGAWDMGELKRTLVLRYSLVGRLLASGYRLGRVLFRQAAPLPAANQPFRELTITRMAVPDRDPAVLRDLLVAAGNDALRNGFHMMHVGFTGDDPLRAATRKGLVQRFRSTLWVGCRRGGDGAELIRGADPYVDLSII